MFRDALPSRGSHPPASGNQQQQAQAKKKSAKKTGKPTGRGPSGPMRGLISPAPKSAPKGTLARAQVDAAFAKAGRSRPHHARADRGSLVETQIQQRRYPGRSGTWPHDLARDRKCSAPQLNSLAPR